MATTIKNPNPNTIIGKIIDTSSRPLANLKVEIYDVAIREWHPLANTLTNREGKYELHWTHEQLTGRNKRCADIAVKVFTVEKNTEIYKSLMDEVRFNASEREEINITIQQPLPKEVVEFDFLVNEIKAIVNNKIGIADLRENDDHRDVTFLANELEVPSDKIEHLIVAHRLHNLSKISADFFYALFQRNTFLHNDFGQNLSARLSIDIGVDDLTLLYDAALTDSKNIIADIKKAVDEKIVSPKTSIEVKRNMEVLEQYKEKASEYYKNEHPEKVITLLSNFFKEGKLQEIQELFKENKNDLNSFFDKVTDPTLYEPKEKEKKANPNNELVKLYGFGQDVIKNIAKAKGIEKPEDGRKLAKLNKKEWVKEITKASPDIKDKKWISTYASAMVRKMENEFPTIAFAAQLARSKKTVLKNQDKIVSFFNKYEDFDLMKHNVDLFLKEKKVANKEKEAINQELKSVQRVFKLIPNYSKTMALREERIHSSQSIVSIGETRFVKEVAPKAGIDEKEAKEIYHNAETKHTAAMLMVGELQDSMSVIDIASFETSGLAKKLEAVSKDFPNLKSLFKLVDTCECEHCRSVYSPAAYLVEILQFLGNRSSFSIPKQFNFSGNLAQGSNHQIGIISIELHTAIQNEGYVISTTTRIKALDNSLTRYEIRDSDQLFIIDKIGETNYIIYKYEFSYAKGELFSRRPELGEIDLGCANANTPVKYIDLVCEILEEAIAPDKGIDFEGQLYNEIIVNGLKQRTITEDLRNFLISEGKSVTDKAKIFGTETETNTGISEPYYLRDTKIVCKISGTGPYKIYHLRQTLSTAEELDASPEYVNEAAYQELSNKAFAFKLPFDLPHTEAKAYINRFDVNRSDLMKAFQSAATPTDEAIAAERLGLTDTERKKITNTPVPNDNAAQQAFWNVPAPGNVVDYLKQVNHFMVKTGLTYKELDLLLKLKFIDKNGNLFIKHHDLTCDTEQKEIANLNLRALDRMHRFLRLQKKTGWKHEVLDEIISQTNLGAGNLYAACLIKAAQLKEISERANIKIEELVGCFGDVPSLILQEEGPKPLYHQIFLNKAKNGIIEAGLFPEKVNGSQLLNPYLGYIATCLQLKQKDIEDLIRIPHQLTDGSIAYTNFLPNNDLTISNLSYLFAASSLVKKLKLKAEDFSIIHKLSGIDFSSSPEKMLEFIKFVEEFKNSPLKATDVRFILTHEASNRLDKEIKVERIKEILGKLKSGYEIINDEQKSKFDETLSAEEQKEIFQLELAKLTSLTTDDVKIFTQFIDSDWKFKWKNSVGEISSLTPVDAEVFLNFKLGSSINITPIGLKLIPLNTAFINAKNANSAQKAATVAIKNAHIAKIGAITPQELAVADAQLAAAEAHELLTSAAAIAANGAFEAQSKEIVKVFLSEIAVSQIQKSKQILLEETLSIAFKADLALTGIILKYAKLKQEAPGTDLISNLLLDISDSAISDVNSNQYASVKLLYKMFLLLNAFKLSETDLEWYLKNNATLGWLELDNIPFKEGQTSIDFTKYLAFCKIVSYSKEFSAVTNPSDAEKSISFFSVVEIILLGTADKRNDFLNKLALLTGYEKDDLDSIDAHLFTVFDLANYKNLENWERLFECADYTRKLGASVDQIKKYINPVLSALEVNDLRATLKSRYDENTWLSTLKEIMDGIRPQKRDALVAYLLATNPDMKDENDLYEYFLVDVEMGACMPSSRIVQAHNSIQLFVQRCLMGLEPDAIADVEKDPNWNQWKWMKNYRAWEANRKVFLYPENWYDVTLTDDKTFLLTEFINEIQQNELTNDTAEEAIKNYLEKLDNIAFLEVMATWYDVPTRDMHVFARTKGGDPSIYYYRRFENERYWSPWEKVELDITGDHLLAFMRNNRLHLAWPMFSEEADPNQQSKVPSTGDQGKFVDTDKPRTRLKIQLAVSEYTNKKWQPKKVSQDSVRTGFTSSKFQINEYNLLYFQFTDQIFILDSEWKDNDTHRRVGIFDLNGCKGYPELVTQKSWPFPDFYPDFKDAEYVSQRYFERPLVADAPVRVSPDDLSIRNAISPLTYYNILDKTPGKYTISFPHQFTSIDLIFMIYNYLIYATNSNDVKHRNGQLKMPFGTLIPYFKQDSYHAYVIIPGFYKKVMDAREFVETYTLNDSEKRTASNVFQLIDDITGWYKKVTFEFQQNPPTDSQVAIQVILSDPDFQNILKDLSVYANLDIFLNLLIGISGDPNVNVFLRQIISEEPLKYGEQFKNMYHTLVCPLRSILYKDGVPSLMKRDTQLQKTNFDFNSHYNPNPLIVPQSFIKNPDGTKNLSYPIEDIDFNSDGSYSAYNWDIFFRLPLHIAGSLTKNQRFEEALTWFHYMFNPTGALPGNGVQKYWVTKPFYLNQATDYAIQRIDTLMYAISDPLHPNVPAGASADPAIRDLEFAISEWRNKPFRPDVVMRFRPVAYQKALLMKYIDNLTEWGDYLFRQDTMESIAQATQMYILADKLLGPKPRIIPAAVKQPYETYNQIEAKIDSFGNALIELENILPDLSVLPEGGSELPSSPVTLPMLYFCIPANENMFEYWDRVADRLFKIRHCQNIDGVERSLALFAPPIDPGMLVRATASGLDLTSVIAGLNAATPYYRFNVISQKATELAQEVRGLGNSLLQVLEKKDSEALTLLRNELELKVLNAVMDIKKLQIAESKEQIEVLQRTKKVTEERQKYYKDIEFMNALEITSLTLNGYSALAFTVGSIMEMSAGAVSLIPDIKVGASGFGGSPHVTLEVGGGKKSADSISSFAKAILLASQVIDKVAGGISTVANYQRRNDDWKLQERLATKELASIDKQITVAEIRKEIAVSDLRNHELQIENAKKTDVFMRSKFTNLELYDWMIGEISDVYFKSYQMAHDFAKKAERCYRFELGNDDSFISYGYWDSMKKGLQSADHLIHDIKRMESSYLDKNKREYEITKHVSLAQLDPFALVRLRTTGICDFEIPEVLYDMDHPGHYFRRLKSVSISLPCIAGPYTSVSSKLSLVNNRYRKNASDPANYPENPVLGDNRFQYNVGAIQSIATSNAQNDSGVFELNFRDERYLPFENTGAISSWRLELPTEVRQFDYNSISDVIVHVRYTAREGGSGLKMAANGSLTAQLQAINQDLIASGLNVTLNMKHDLPNEWHSLKKNGIVDLIIDKSRLPYMAQSFNSAMIDSVMFVAKVKGNPAIFSIKIAGTASDTNLARVDELALCTGINLDIGLDTKFTLSVSNADRLKLDDLMMIVKYKF